MKAHVSIWRDEHGVQHVEADNESDLYWGQGYVHAADRGLQMLLMRLLGQGRASELLEASEDMLAVDIFFRRMNWAGQTELSNDILSPEARTSLESYCDGVNTAFAKRYPWELKLLGYRPEPWRIDDMLLISRMVGYLTLAQSQAEMERLLVEMIQNGVPQDKLVELFPGLLNGLDIDLAQQIKLSERIVPPHILWNIAVPRMMASNNWVVSGQKTASGKPILSNDPHLEVNRLPNIWCEIVLQTKDRYLMGGSMPGSPGILSGRNPDVAWGATYAFMDAIDSWIERCKDGRYYREPDDWLPFRERKERIIRKKKAPVEVTFYENEHGVLESDPNQEGYYLATRWTAAQSGATTFCQLLKMWNASTVEEGMDRLGKIETAWCFVLADRQGNIGFQMSGLLPKRREGISGVVPLPGWKKENDWNGFASHTKLPRVLNPEQGYFATANQDLNEYGKVRAINLPMGPYRAERIHQLLEQGENLTPSDMFRMHGDVYSLQAEQFMTILRPLLPDTKQGSILRDWDLSYTVDSEGAFLFEEFDTQLRREVFGKRGVGEGVIDYLSEETGIFIDFYPNFDRILLDEESVWFDGESRENLYRRVAAQALSVELQTWGKDRKVMLNHILFGGKLPAFLGFDRGPITMIGGRAIVHQGQIYRSANRITTFSPSFRIVSDLATDECYSNMAGGPSDRRFSKWYCSDLENWLTGKYKILAPQHCKNTIKRR